MVLDNNRLENDPFIVDGERIEEVESLYLGSLINIKGCTTGTEKMASNWL